jgi:hypothetical protein
LIMEIKDQMEETINKVDLIITTDHIINRQVNNSLEVLDIMEIIKEDMEEIINKVVHTITKVLIIKVQDNNKVVDRMEMEEGVIKMVDHSITKDLTVKHQEITKEVDHMAMVKEIKVQMVEITNKVVPSIIKDQIISHLVNSKVQVLLEMEEQITKILALSIM